MISSCKLLSVCALVALSDDYSSVLLSVILGAINITMLAPHSIDFARAASAAGQLFKLIDRESLIDPLDTSGEKPSETQGLVELENVTFAYPTRPGITVLDDFTLTVPAGKVTAIVVCLHNSPLIWRNL